ncbi:MAG: hypothetical protein HY435_03345 [Candidatus Liptonbacteria bacterium]|nr:hypothetical protein [Candidatus Liptonbacteria bacterium]
MCKIDRKPALIEKLSADMSKGYFCPFDGTKLIYNGRNSLVRCGGISYYSCPKQGCGRWFRESQRGIIARGPNLTEIPAPKDKQDRRLQEKLDYVIPR